MIQITDINSSGQGVGKDGNIVTFIPYTIVGEQVEAQIVRREKNYQIGFIKSIIKPSENRCAPLCPYYGICGGCSLMHMSYDSQLKCKENIVKSALLKIGKLDFNVSPILSCKNQVGYRNKASFPVKNGKIGYYQEGSHNIVEIDACPLLKKDINDALFHIRPFIAKYGSNISHVVIRSTCGQIMITIVTDKDKYPYKAELLKCLKPINPASINININKNPRHILGQTTVNIWGKPYTQYKVGGNTFKASAISFLQVNDCQTEILYNAAASLVDIKDQHIIDAYCGMGTISLMLAKTAASVVGIELNPQSIKNAKQAAKENGINNASFICGKCQSIIPDLMANKPSAIFMDPPRAGVDKTVINPICGAPIKNIVYISCNPSTLARDLSLLCNGGYTLQKVIPVDMFPNTSHVECVCLMTRKEK